jgi:hypothetical protein
MPINIQVGKAAEEETQQNLPEKEEKKESSIKSNLKIRKSLDGNLLIYDLEDLDIVVDQNKGKIVAFATDGKADDRAYDAQNRFFKFLVKKGVIDPSSVHSGNIFGTLEGKIVEPKDTNLNKYDIVLLVLDKWIEKEKPSDIYKKAVHDKRDEELTDPDDDESTPLGKVPHQDTKGSGEKTGGQGMQRPYEE